MKKLLVLTFICAAVVISCGKKIIPESDANNPSGPANDKSTNTSGQSGNTNASSETTPSFNNMKGTQTAIPDGSRPVDLDPGKTVYVTKCNSCHALKSPGDFTVDQTFAYLKIEIPKAKLSNKEKDQLTAYLIANAKR